MWYPRVGPIAVSFSFLFLLTISSSAFGQRLGGGRTVGKFGGGVRGSVGGNVAAPALRGGAQVRPVPLTVSPRATVNNVIRPSQPGFQHHHFGFFFNKFAFFSGFPFFPGFFPFDPFAPDRVGLFRIPGRHLGVPGIGRRRVGFFHHPFPFGGFFGWPYFGTSSGYQSPDVFTDTTYAHETSAVREISLGQQLELSGVAAGDTLEVERVSLMDVVPRSVLRLTWRNLDLPAAQVALFLADSSQSVLSAQTLRSPPFTALFEPHPATAFVGMTVVWPDGTLSTRFAPYRKGPR
jgi:hypothetical protein